MKTKSIMTPAPAKYTMQTHPRALKRAGEIADQCYQSIQAQRATRWMRLSLDGCPDAAKRDFDLAWEAIYAYREFIPPRDLDRLVKLIDLMCARYIRHWTLVDHLKLMIYARASRERSKR